MTSRQYEQPSLTPAEETVLQANFDGYSIAETAEFLSLTPKEVARLLRKGHNKMSYIGELDFQD